MFLYAGHVHPSEQGNTVTACKGIVLANSSPTHYSTVSFPTSATAIVIYLLEKAKRIIFSLSLEVCLPVNAIQVGWYRDRVSFVILHNVRLRHIHVGKKKNSSDWTYCVVLK